MAARDTSTYARAATLKTADLVDQGRKPLRVPMSRAKCQVSNAIWSASACGSTASRFCQASQWKPAIT